MNILDYYKDSGEPIKCLHCESENIKNKVRSVDCGYISESEVNCGDCNKIIGYWGYGFYDPEFMMDAIKNAPLTNNQGDEYEMRLMQKPNTF